MDNKFDLTYTSLSQLTLVASHGPYHPFSFVLVIKLGLHCPWLAAGSCDTGTKPHPLKIEDRDACRSAGSEKSCEMVSAEIKPAILSVDERWDWSVQSLHVCKFLLLPTSLCKPYIRHIDSYYHTDFFLF